jgi:hypothetical protein
VAVVERDVGRRAHDDRESAVTFHAQRLEDPGVGREVGEVVLLLEPGELLELLPLGADAREPRGRDRVGRDDAPGEPAADVVLLDRELVVEHVDGRDAREGGGDRELVRAMRDREVERTAGRASDGAGAPQQVEQLARSRRPPVRPHGRVGHTVQLEQFERLRIVAGGDRDVVPLLLQPSDHGPEHDRMRRRRHVEPQTHPGRGRY